MLILSLLASLKSKARRKKRDLASMKKRVETPT
jgi:hypothetical protein